LILGWAALNSQAADAPPPPTAPAASTPTAAAPAATTAPARLRWSIQLLDEPGIPEKPGDLQR